ncbi:hypothetical protein D6Z43_04660 [Pseudomonas sp. DY-1]|uniref:hypothetical protein n=1 Tax=Pseudomonas sp. DY-1 TaxID=1755504 RepID=UPI000EA98160|nr:hypothetical protein [Pseudomonas sp. DY-1]AYF86482.1 hypothetical protein D6Z43_04660 [Pseudomonas sp. DY-1]
MATFNFRAHDGLTSGHAAGVIRDVANLVAQAAVGVGWNQLGAAPQGFTMTNVNGRMLPIHTPTGIRFKAGFCMYQTAGSQKWEGHATTADYRLDLQSIDNGWANWAIQTNGANSKTVATCLMEVDKAFSQGQLMHGLKQSAIHNRLYELTQ